MGIGMRYVVTLVILLSLVCWVGVSQRHRILIDFLSSGTPPPLLEAADEGLNTTWYDDYFTIEALGPRTFAIGEPRYAQQNYSYLIIGSERAVLVDAGPGFRDIRAVAESLTERPITFVPSHFHYDHTGNTVTFERVAVVDLPYIRERARDNVLTLSWAEHLGSSEGVALPTLEVDEWLAPDSILSLGDRSLRVLYTPGHTTDSISLLDLGTGLLFSGDFIYPGPLYAFLPNSSMGDYMYAAENVLANVSEKSRIFGAHRVEAPGAPELARSDVEDLRHSLGEINADTANASGVYPREYRVNERLQLLAEPAWLQDWAITVNR